MTEIRDITRPVRDGMPVWPGDPPCRLAWAARIAEGAAANVAELRCGTHAGTHADGPYHVLEDGARIGAAPLGAFWGPAAVADVRGAAEIGADAVDAILAAHPGVPRVLLRTGAWTDPDAFPTRFPALTPAAAARLVAAGVVLVGTDAPSPDRFDSADLPVHRLLLGAGIAILENLLLDDAPPGAYELVALPLRLEAADASPVRAALRPLRGR